jgi:hypothetical protein
MILIFGKVYEMITSIKSPVLCGTLVRASLKLPWQLQITHDERSDINPHCTRSVTNSISSDLRLFLAVMFRRTASYLLILSPVW